MEARPKIVKALGKGQITIPAEFRAALGIEAESLLSVSLVGDHLEVTPLRRADDLRVYSDEDLDRFLAEDRIDAETASKVRALIHRGAI
ncbi:MAG: AbrB/MazE/SpoVT family DNA-binding domain-containing protein [Candidatus Sericytochromatia bacterium]|nr:AbrB/MazE/SpoVT family DNA-binding domain-containing protein [Candidatus Tanganyikabacteria bacterium]